MQISLIVAMDKNRLIGRNGRLPWRLPDDMKWFRQQTMGKPVIMGRKTYESIPARFRPLPGRHNIVVTGNRLYRADGAIVAHGPEEAIAAARDAPEAMVVGGAQLYAYLLPQASRLYLTLIEAEFAGDAFFPELDPADWQEISRVAHEVDGRHPYRFSWVILTRRRLTPSGD